MSSATGIDARRARERFSAEDGVWRLAAILSSLLKLGQARPVVALLTVSALVVCLTTRHDPARFVLAGGLGLLGLSGLLFRDGAGRLMFASSSLLLLGLYTWAGAEAVRLELMVDGDRVL